MSADPHAEALARYLGAFAGALADAGVAHLCLCPGSRSTPLALTFARQGRLKLWLHLDERSCAYFALGLARATRLPVALLCTSGTAAVNFAPAVAEAYQAHVPLVVLTADRPPELRDLGANQTIDQTRLYGTGVKWFAEMLLPESRPAAIDQARLAATRAVAASLEGSPGPVHLNFPLREPLMPAVLPDAEPAPVPLVVTRGVRHPSDADLATLREALSGARHGIVVCGPQDEPGFAAAAVDLAQRLGWPLLADPLSQVRCGGQADASVVSLYDNFLRDAATTRRLQPDIVLRFGAAPVSKPLATFLQRRPGLRQLLVTPDTAWRDPDLAADVIVQADATAFCRDLASVLEADGPEATFSGVRGAPGSNVDRGWLGAWRQAENATRAALDAALSEEGRLSEPGVFHQLAACLPDGASVFAGNSMPVRDLDGFFAASQRPARFFANRGVSGIDGVVSSALGVAAAGGGRVVLVIGDLSFYHDMNGLLAVRRFGLDATIVLVNNDGGGIFSFLPQHEDAQSFEALFGTPHGLDFAPVAQLYGLDWRRAETPPAYRDALEASFARPGVSVIEVRTDREANLRLHQRLWRDVAAALNGAPK